MGRRKLQTEDKLFWNVVYNELVRVDSCEVHLPKYLKIRCEKRYTDAYPVNFSDIKVYACDSTEGFYVANEVANHFDLDIEYGIENTKFGQVAFAIIKIPKYLYDKVYNDDYEDN